MSPGFPNLVDAWRMVSARRSFQGALPLARMPRLCVSLAEGEGEVFYRLQFDKDEFSIAYLRVQVETELPLLCQRTLDVYKQPVSLDVRLGLITQESEEAALPAAYEPLLVLAGQLCLAEVIEDELVLALPVVPVKPGAPLDYINPEYVEMPIEESVDMSRQNPFAALSQLKK